MGVPLTPLVVKQTSDLGELAGRRLAVDGNGELHQFLALIRLRDGTPLRDSSGRISSHLVGLFYRTTRLIADFGLKLIFVFDGTPPSLKSAEIERRRQARTRFEAEYAAAHAAGDFATAASKATMTSRLSREMVNEARQLLRLLGLPVVDAPGEGEAQAAHMTSRGDAWAAASKDYDTLLFGTPRLLRFLAVSGKQFLPSTGTFRSVAPELIDAAEMLRTYGLSREQLVDLAILVGTDFNEGIKGVGPKRALKLVQQHGTLDSMPDEIRRQVPRYEDIRQIYLQPHVRNDYELTFSDPDEDAIVRMLCDEREFSRARVTNALTRMRTPPLLH